MENIPSSSAEVKQIIDVMSFRTGLRYAWLKGDDGLFKHPFGFSWDGDKELVFPLDLQDVAGDDPDRELLFMDPPDLQTDEVAHYNGAAVCFIRQAKPGEVDELRLAIWRARAEADAHPERARPAETSMPDPARENIVELPNVEKQPERHNRPPRDVMKYGGKILHGEDWKSTIYMAYKLSWYGPLNEIPDYAGKSKKVGRYYTQGRAELVEATGLSGKTISKHRGQAVAAGLIIMHRRGYPAIDKKGVRHSKKGYCSIWELPFNLPHVFAWKRKTQKEVRRRH